jgi:type II secretory pathway pseudopilin PulG
MSDTNEIKKVKKNNLGISLMELIVVLAVIAIIGAILVPNLFGIADRARLRSDLQSTMVLRNALNLYALERGSAPSGDITQVLQRLYEMHYIASEVLPSDPQTTDAVWAMEGGQIVLLLPSGVDTASLTDAEILVIGGR